MPLELYEDSFGDWRNAVFLGTASDIAYLPQDQATPLFREKLGLEAQLISRGNTQVYVASNPEHIVLAFRGTEAPTSIEGLKDWLLTDALNLLMIPQGRLGTDFAAAGVAARFHQGFIDAIADIWEPVYEATTAELKKSERPLWITGHSLGGALALLSSWLFLRRFVNVHQIYTYGGPMVGNKEATQAFDHQLAGKIFRCVEPRDPVPQLPTMSLVANDYNHCEKLMGLGEIEPGSYWRALASHAVGGVFTGGGLDAAWKYISERVGAHSMDTYMDQLKKR